MQYVGRWSFTQQYCVISQRYSMVLRWSLFLGEVAETEPQEKDSSLSLPLLSRHFTQEAIKQDWQSVLPVTWKQACGRRMVAHDGI